MAYTAAEEMEIARIGVVKEMWRQGVARELLGALEKIGKQSGIEKILCVILHHQTVHRIQVISY